MLSAKEIDLALARRDRLYANIPRCQCGSDQVQLISATPPAAWRCRRCKTSWTFEPSLDAH